MSLHIVIGCMFSGKSTELLRRADVARSAGQRVLVITHACDTRYGDSCVASHDGAKAPAVALSNINNALRIPDYAAAQSVFVEEAQFFNSNDLADFVTRVVEQDGKMLTVCGLDGDYMRRPFRGLLDLIPLADTVARMMRARCGVCGAPALFSRRLQAAHGVLVVGGAESYMPACRKCWCPPPPVDALDNC